MSSNGLMSFQQVLKEYKKCPASYGKTHSECLRDASIIYNEVKRSGEQLNDKTVKKAIKNTDIDSVQPKRPKNKLQKEKLEKSKNRRKKMEVSEDEEEISQVRNKKRAQKQTYKDANYYKNKYKILKLEQQQNSDEEEEE